MTALEIKLEDRLRQMTGHQFLYNAKPVKVLSHRFENGNCILVTSGPWITLPVKEMSQALDDFLEMDEDEPTTALARSAPVPVQEVQTLSVFADLKAVLMENIRKVQQDKEYVAQAQVVSHGVKMVIELAKTEISAIKTINDITNNR